MTRTTNGDDAFHRLEERLDWVEMRVEAERSEA